MKVARGIGISVIALALAGSASLALAKGRTVLPGKTWAWTFSADTLGQPPAATRVSGGRWVVEEDSTAALSDSSASRIIRQLESDDGIGYHVLQFTKPLLEDQEMSVRFRIRSGEIDPSAGIAFQLDPKGRNGYLVRVSGKDRELIAHYLLGGRRRDIKYTSVEPPKPGEWHTLAVRRFRDVIEVRYDGAMAAKLRDERFRRGNIALWTEDDTVADFTDLKVTSL